MDFQKAKQDLDNEIYNYQVVYDSLVSKKAVDGKQIITDRKNAFDDDIAVNTADFDTYYDHKISELKAHVTAKKDQFRADIDEAEISSQLKNIKSALAKST